MAVVGIDIGTQFSKVAVAYNNTISMMPNDLFKISTPTLIGYSDKQREFGDAAETSFPHLYDNTVTHVKRFLARHYDDPNLLEELYKWNYCKIDCRSKTKEENDHDDERRDEESLICFEVTTSEGLQKLSPEQVLGSYLRKLKEWTMKYLENATEITHCVLTCPFYFTDAQRRSLMAAATLAGWNVSHLLNEPTAAAITYAMSRTIEQNRRVMFVDMGYSNTQVSIVDFGSNHLQMYAIGSDPFLGARDFDYALFDYFRKQFEKQYHIDLSQHPRARMRLMKGVERIKQLLTANKDAIHMLECLINDIDFNLRITRQEFDILCAPLLYKLGVCVQNAIDAMNMRDIKTYTNANRPPIIHSVEIIGGGTRIRSVQERLMTVFKQHFPESQIDKCSTTLNGDECVARGAALMCAKESPIFRVRELQIQDINNWPVMMKYPVNALENPTTSINQQIVFPLYTPCPDTTSVLFDQKKSFRIVLEHPNEYEIKGHELKYPMKCNLTIGEFQVPRIKSKSTNSQIQLLLSLNKHGLLDMPQAQLVESLSIDEEVELMDFNNTENENKKRKIIKNLPVTGKFYSEIANEQINEWIALENKLTAADRIIKETNDQRNELETYVYDMRNKLDDVYKDLISESDKEEFLKELDDVERWLYDGGKNGDKTTYMNKLQELKHFSDVMLNKHQEMKQKPQRIETSQIFENNKNQQLRNNTNEKSELENRDSLSQKEHKAVREKNQRQRAPKNQQIPKSQQTAKTKPIREKKEYYNENRNDDDNNDNNENYNNDFNGFNDFNDFFYRPKKRRGPYLRDLSDFFADF